MKFTAIIQARMGSTRLPGKIFLPLAGRPLLAHAVERVARAQSIDEIVVATTTAPADARIAQWAHAKGLRVHRGSEEDVLARYYSAATRFNARHIVRITADDPFKDPEVIDGVVALYTSGSFDFAYNNKPPSFPEGLDVEVFSLKALAAAFQETCDPYDREHVTPYLYNHPDRFQQANLAYPEDISHLRWTIDTTLDYRMATEVYTNLDKGGNPFLMQDILLFLKHNPQVAEINRHVARSAMYVG